MHDHVLVIAERHPRNIATDDAALLQHYFLDADEGSDEIRSLGHARWTAVDPLDRGCVKNGAGKTSDYQSIVITAIRGTISFIDKPTREKGREGERAVAGIFRTPSESAAREKEG